jgi:AhpD family alkylhydroperoxidase
MDYNTFGTHATEARNALTAMGKAAADAGLDKKLMELVKLRASQINGCAFCVQFHINTARTLKMPQQQLDMLAVWRHSDAFSPAERAALAVTEELTVLTSAGLSEESFQAARDVFGEKLLAQLIVTVGVINAWNRIGISLGFTPPPAA